MQATKRCLAAVLCLLGLGVGCSDAERTAPLVPAEPVANSAAEPDAQLIILISIDTLRADHLGSYGYSRDTSPRLDRLAADGGQCGERCVAVWGQGGGSHRHAGDTGPRLGGDAVG